uniref:Uncharacterized protein n=1 Tax=Daphnia galeata TaxID=27404 RepID=A0A8J2RTN1_9CRUS|nr:unnamed protein product [Daphnia galeata]
MDRHGQRAMIVAQFAVMAILVAVFAIEEDDLPPQKIRTSKQPSKFRQVMDLTNEESNFRSTSHRHRRSTKSRGELVFLKRKL